MAFRGSSLRIPSVFLRYRSSLLFDHTLLRHTENEKLIWCRPRYETAALGNAPRPEYVFYFAVRMGLFGNMLRGFRDLPDTNLDITFPYCTELICFLVLSTVSLRFCSRDIWYFAEMLDGKFTIWLSSRMERGNFLNGLIKMFSKVGNAWKRTASLLQICSFLFACLFSKAVLWWYCLNLC